MNKLAQMKSSAPALRSTLAAVEEFSWLRVRAKCGDNSLINLASNENPLGLPPCVGNAWQKIMQRCHVYPTDAYYVLQQEIAKTIKAGATPENVIVTNGSTELIQLIMQQYTEPGKEVIVSDPTWPAYAHIADHRGVTVVRVPSREWRCDLDAMSKAIGSKTQAIFICNPSNPLGSIVDRTSLERWICGLPRTVLLVLDEAYREFVADGLMPQLVEKCLEGRVIIARTFSKAHGLAGLRVGYGIASSSIAARLLDLRLPYSTNNPGLLAAAYAIGDGTFIEKTREFVGAQREKLTYGLRGMGCQVPESHANFVFVVTPIRSDHLSDKLLRRNIWVRMAGPEAVRISIGTEQQNSVLLTSMQEIMDKAGRAEPAPEPAVKSGD